MNKNIPGENFLGGSFPGGFPKGSLMGGNFLGGNSPAGIFVELSSSCNVSILIFQNIINKLNMHCKFLILILRKKNTQNKHIIAHFEYFFTCHYSKTVWLAENLNEIKITHYEKIFSHIKQKFSHFEKGLRINNIFVASLRLPLFSPRHITLKRNQKIISKICYYLT